MINTCVQFSINHKYFVLFLFILLTTALGYQTKDLKLDNANEQFWIEDAPSLVEYKKFHEKFGSEEFFLIYFHSSDLTSKKNWEIIDQVHRDLSHISLDNKVAFKSILSPLHTPINTTPNGDQNFDKLINIYQNKMPNQIQDLQNKHLDNHPIFTNLLYAKDGKSAGILTSIFKGRGDKYVTQLADIVEEICKKHSSPDLIVAALGPPALKHQLDQTTSSEALLFGLTSLLITILALIILYRRPAQVIATTTIIIFSIISTFGLITIFTGKINLVLIILPLVLIITGLGSGIHILNAFRHFQALTGDFKDSIHKAFTATGKAVFFTSLTTSAGFLSMLAVPIEPIRVLGIYTAIGVMIIFFAAITLFPAILAFDPKYKGIIRTEPNGHPVLEFVSKHTLKNPQVTTLCCLSFVAFACVGLFHLEIDSNFGKAFKKNHPHRIALEAVDKNLAGTAAFEILIDTEQPNGILEPDFLNKLEQFETYIQNSKSHVIPHILSINSIFKLLSQSSDSSKYLPKSSDAAEQLLMLYEFSDAANSRTNNFFDADKQIAHLTLFSRNLATSQVSVHEQDILEKANQIFNAKIISTGIMSMFAQLTSYIVLTQLKTFALAGLAIILFMMWVLGSVKLGFVTMLPNLLPILATYGVMGWLGIELDWLNAIIPGVSLGFAVDGTIHFGLTYKHIRESTQNAVLAAHETILRIGKAVTITSVTLSVGFCIFGFSDMLNLAALGLLLALCFFFALLADIILTPALLVWVDNKN